MVPFDRPQYRFHRLSCGVGCVSLWLATLVEHRRMPDRQTYRQTDRQTQGNGIYRARQRSRGINDMMNNDFSRTSSAALKEHKSWNCAQVSDRQFCFDLCPGDSFSVRAIHDDLIVDCRAVRENEQHEALCINCFRSRLLDLSQHILQRTA